ncbi:MAG: hypothetical protein KatS3mg110_1265 [Pirellulaceae bacterium]|nr:MAG: hypothetical protein KatS3mg110_1265 [Pirellulaceae bacterium]
MKPGERWSRCISRLFGTGRHDPARPERFRVTLYSRRGCHLCDEAFAILRAHGVEPQVVDIDQDERLRERFDTCVPVVEIDGKVRFRGRINPVLLRRLLRRPG